MFISLRTDLHLEKVKAWCTKEGHGGFAVREVAGEENEHWHWLIETDKNLVAVRRSFQRAIPELKGNGAYSLVEVRDLEKYERYLCKGSSESEMPEVAWRHSILYTDEKIEELHDLYWSENRRLKKRKVGSMIDWVVDEAKAKGINWDDRSKLAELYIRELGERGKPINLFSVRSNLNTVQVALCPDDKAIEALVNYCQQYG